MRKNIRINFSEKKLNTGMEKINTLLKSNNNVEVQYQDIMFISIKNFIIYKQYVLFKKNKLIIFNIKLNKKISNYRSIKYTELNIDLCINSTIVELILDNKNYYLVISSRIRPIEESYFWTVAFNLMTNRYINNFELRNSLLSKIQSGNILEKYSIILGYYFLNSMIAGHNNESGFINQNEMNLINNEIIKGGIQKANKLRDNKVRLAFFNDYIWDLQIPFDFYWRINEINEYFKSISIIPSFVNMDRYMVYHDLLIYINDSFKHATKNPGTKVLGQSTRYFGYLKDNEKPNMYSYSDFEREHQKAIDKIIGILKSNEKHMDKSLFQL